MSASCEGVSVDELCPVCGDTVSGYHYGLLTCESCKGFFKRSVQNKKKYSCVEQQRCTINKTQRRRCPSCRFNKCLQVGMRLEAVRADRMRGGRNMFGPMYKRDKEQRKALMQGSRFSMKTTTQPPSSSRVTQHQCTPPLEWSTSSSMVTQDQCTPPLEWSTSSTSSSRVTQHQCTPPLEWSTSSTSSSRVTQHQCTPFLEWSTNSTSSSMVTQDQCTPFLEWSTKSEHISGSSSSVDGQYPGGPRVPQLMQEFLRCDPDELQLLSRITARLQQYSSSSSSSSSSSCSLQCIVADQMLHSLVEWARTSIFFKQLQVCDQMKLLHRCWSPLLLLDLVSRQVLCGKESHLLLLAGQQVELSQVLCHAGPIELSLIQRGRQLVEKLLKLQVDRQEFACIKFLILFNPADMTGLDDPGFIQSVQEQAEGALLEYTLYSSQSRFALLLQCVSELRRLSSLTESYLYRRHLSSERCCNNLLSEMLQAKLSWNE